MIRFVNLRGQINNDGDPHFAFFDTVRDKFLEFNHSQEWDLVEDFTDDAQHAPEMVKRCLGLIPLDYFLSPVSRERRATAEERLDAMEARETELCPFCGKPPQRFRAKPEHGWDDPCGKTRIRCITYQCPLNGLEFKPEQWNSRAVNSFSPNGKALEFVVELHVADLKRTVSVIRESPYAQSFVGTCSEIEVAIQELESALATARHGVSENQEASNEEK